MRKERDLDFMFIIEDAIHCDGDCTDYPTFALALAEIRRRVGLPWDELPNVAPCTSWQTCGRFYIIYEYNHTVSDSIYHSKTPVVTIDANGVTWEPDFELR